MDSPLKLSQFSVAIAARGIVGLAAVVAADLGFQGAAATLLAAAVAADLVVEAAAKRRNWVRGELELHLESLVDFVSFVWGPVALATSGDSAMYLSFLAAGFVIAGALRLVRFNVEGLVDGGFRGVPVTYNGAAFPIAFVVAQLAGELSEDAAFTIVFVLGIVLMPSGRFILPQIRP